MPTCGFQRVNQPGVMKLKLWSEHEESHGTAAAYPDRARELRLPADAGYGLLGALSLPVTPDRCR